MTVRIPLEVSTSGVENVNKIKEEVDKVKEDIDEIISNTESTESSESSTGKKSNKKNSSKEPKTKIDKALQNDLGFSKANNLLGYATNPSGAVLQQLLKIGALPAAIIGAPIVAAKVIEFLQTEGNLLDRFFNDTIDTRNNAFRDKNQQQRILQGFDQLIISTIDGDFNPRNSYNSFEIFQTDRTLLENDFKIRKSVN